MNVFEKTGKMALGSRMRALTAKMTDDAAKIYEMYEVQDFAPKWFPAYFLLAEEGEKTITDIAEQIGHSQPSVTKIIKEMTHAGLINTIESTDKRRNIVGLSEKGIKLYDTIKIQCKDIDAAIETMMNEATYNIWEAIREWEHLLEKRSLLKRVQDQKKNRESKDVEIVEYKEQYQDAFKSLNEEWISTYFEMEEADYKALDHPNEYIIDKGGKILVAFYKGEPVGVCALIKMDDPHFDYEMAKMAVSPKVQGKSIGWKLGQAIVEKAKSLSAANIYLESNTILKPAINLYYKLGFQKIAGHATPYKRCNIQMELKLI